MSTPDARPEGTGGSAARGGAGDGLLADLAARVEAEAGLPPPPAPTYAAALLDELRAGMVAGWLSGPEPPPSPERARAVLGAFDRVRERLLSPGGEHSPLKVIAEFAHDLRSPLTSILFLAGALREGQGGALAEPQRRQVGIIYSAALGMVSLASDMIELHRGPGGAGELTPLSVGGMLESLADVLAPLAEEKQLELRLRPCDGDWRLGNPVSLSRVLLNLVVNALQSTDQGWVEIAAEPAGGGCALRFSVRDTGHGIDPEALDPATGHFRRHGDGYGFSRTGLGLGICRKLVAEMGGELSVESAPGAGTRVWFTLELPEVPGH